MDEFEKEWLLIQQTGLKDSALRQKCEQKAARLCELPQKLRTVGKNRGTDCPDYV